MNQEEIKIEVEDQVKKALAPLNSFITNTQKTIVDCYTRLGILEGKDTPNTKEIKSIFDDLHRRVDELEKARVRQIAINTELLAKQSKPLDIKKFFKR